MSQYENSSEAHGKSPLDGGTSTVQEQNHTTSNIPQGAVLNDGSPLVPGNTVESGPENESTTGNTIGVPQSVLNQETGHDEAKVVSQDEKPTDPKSWYRITGLVDAFDEQGNIISQYPVGSRQELTVEYGDKQVELGQAERIEE